MKYITILLVSVVIITSSAFSRSSRVNQIPNGSINNCTNCHNNKNGDGTRSPFGIEIENNFLSNGNVVWNAELAGIDSDGDGFTNGEELQDPLGTWKSGEPAPGNLDFVSNPGNPNSIPNTTKAETFSLKSGFFINSITPNPSNGNLNVTFHSNRDGDIEIELYDLRGKVVAKLYKGFVQAGDYSVPLIITGKVSHGNYFLNIRLNGYSWIEKINFIR
ncbi:MAG: T9SS type A sorting domain-containing protein [bacterium]